MARFKVVITDSGFENTNQEQAILGAIDADVVVEQCTTADQVAKTTSDADALIVQWAPITGDVIERLARCRVIVRNGIGFDNIDIRAAGDRGIPVCNVPDYCIDEVANHTIALALALARQLPQLDARVRNKPGNDNWRIVPDQPMPALRELTFATIGFGRIARTVLSRARAFGFLLAAYDPNIAQDEFREAGVIPLTAQDIFKNADILSLHAPLTAETRHIVNEHSLQHMKPTAIVVNTARGELIDTMALAKALDAGTIAGAGLDVYETEPLPGEHPLRRCKTALLTSHVAWYSESSVPTLQRLAAEEAVRGLLGQPLKNQVNA